MIKSWMGWLGVVGLVAGFAGGNRAWAGDQGGGMLTLSPAWGEASNAVQSLAPGWAGAVPGEGELLSTGPANPSPLATVALLDVAAPEGEKSARQWRVLFELPIWASGTSGKVGARGFKVPANASFSDILQNTDSIVGLGGRFEFDYGRWIFYASGLYMKLTSDTIPVGPASITAIAELTIADAGIMYRFGTWNLGGGGTDPTIDVAGGMGARYMHVGLSVNTLNGLSRSQGMDWADPVAIGQITLDLDKHWQILARGDIGGGSSDLTWAAGVFLGYSFRFPNDMALGMKLGYQAVSEDYHNGSGANQGTWDVILHGPMMVFDLSF